MGTPASDLREEDPAWLAECGEQATKIQATWRGYWERTRIMDILLEREKKHRAEYEEYIRRYWAAFTIQIFWRHICMRREAKKHSFVRKASKAAIRLQAIGRGHLARQKSLHALKASIKMQALARGRSARSLVEKLRQEKNFNATKLQSCYRSYMARQEYRNKKRNLDAAIDVQRLYRGHSARTLVWEKRKAKAKEAVALYSQKRHRGGISRDRVRKLRAARLIQRVFRGYLGRKELRRLKRRDRAARTIQRFARHVQAQKLLASLKDRKAAEKAALALQCAWRRHTANQWAQKLRQRKLLRAAALKFQCCYRGYKARWLARKLQYRLQRTRAALKLQKWWRALKSRWSDELVTKKKRRQQAAKILQRNVRGYLSRKRFYKKRCNWQRQMAAPEIQRIYRGHLTRRRFLKLRDNVRKQHVASVFQATFRAYKARQRAQRMRDERDRNLAATKIQSVSRKNSAQKIRDALQRDKAALHLQTSVRAFVARKKVSALQEETQRDYSALVIQRCFWEFKKRKRAQEERLAHASATQMQRLFRGFSSRTLQQRSVRERATIVISRCYRGYRDRKMAAYMKAMRRETRAATNIQRLLRGLAARKEFEVMRLREVERAKKMKAATIQIQALLRGFAVRKGIADLALMVTIIQRWWRAYKDRQLFNMVCNGVSKLQAAVRGGQQRSKLLRGIRGIIRLQRLFRHQQAVFEHRCDAFLQGVILLQARIRGILARQAYAVLYEANLPEDELIDSMFLTNMLLRQILLGNRSTLMKIFKGYIKYPEQTMTDSTVQKFAQHFQIMPKIVSKRDLQDLVSLVTWRNKHKDGMKLLSFEQYLKLLLIIAMRYIAYEDFSYQYEDRLQEVQRIPYKFSELLVLMDKTDGKTKVASAGRINENIPKFMLVDNPNLPSPEKTERTNLVSNKPMTPQGSSPGSLHRSSTSSHKLQRRNSIGRRKSSRAYHTASFEKNSLPSPPSRQKVSPNSDITHKKSRRRRVSSATSVNERRVSSSTSVNERSYTYSEARTPNKATRRSSILSNYSDAYSVESDGSLGMDDFNDYSFTMPAKGKSTRDGEWSSSRRKVVASRKQQPQGCSTGRSVSPLEIPRSIQRRISRPSSKTSPNSYQEERVAKPTQLVDHESLQFISSVSRRTARTRRSHESLRHQSPQEKRVSSQRHSGTSRETQNPLTPNKKIPSYLTRKLSTR